MGELTIRTVLVGIDGACQRVLNRLDASSIPTLRSLLDSGTSSPLRSQLPPWTPSAWPSLYTGTNPGKHGVFDFLTFDGYDWSVVDATQVRARPIWELLDEGGYRSVVVNVPVTHPARPFDGALVPGYVAPEPPTCHPRGLFSKLRSEIGEYPLYPDSGADPSAAVEAVVSRGAAFRYLADRFDPDFGFVQFQQTDTVFHERPGDWETIERIYAAVDAEIERIVRRYDPENVFVVSDHGIGPVDGVEFRVNDYLSRTGYVETVGGGNGMPSWASARAGTATGDTDGSVGLASLQRTAAAAARLGLTSQRVADVLDRVGLAETVARRFPMDLIRAGSEQVDFAASRAYMRSRTECGIRLNVEGREPDGTVPVDAYEAVRTNLIESLRELETPDGDRLFEAVLPREAVFEGPAVERAVDVVLVPRAFDHFLSASIRGSVFGEPSEPWNHKLLGVFAARGADVDTGRSLDRPTLLDVAPTVLATFDVPVDERMDGEVLPIVEAAGRARYRRPERPERPDVTPRERPDVQRHLTDLGYLEDG